MTDLAAPTAPIEDTPIRRAKARIGQTLRGRWHLEALLGIGGMAAVYAATHRNGRRVALKVLHAELSAHPEVRRRFLDEGYAANCIVHPAAVAVLDDEMSDEGEVFLVMDRLDGETLEDRMRREGPLPESEVITIADTLLDVLATAHELGIVHRDVKPDNVFLTNDGKVKLLDFGIARVSTPGRKRNTLQGAPLGTPAFMPPEQALGHWEQIDGRTDLWAVGATMFTALTGKLVHEGGTDNEELLQAMTCRAKSLAHAAPHISRELARIVDCALSFDRERRWPSAVAMQLAVRAVAVLVGAARRPLPTPVSESTPPLAFSPQQRTQPPRAKATRKAARARAMTWASYATYAFVAAAAAFAFVKRQGVIAMAAPAQTPAAAATREDTVTSSHFRLIEPETPPPATSIEAPPPIAVAIDDENPTVTKSAPATGRAPSSSTRAAQAVDSRTLAGGTGARGPAGVASSGVRSDPLDRRK